MKRTELTNAQEQMSTKKKKTRFEVYDFWRRNSTDNEINTRWAEVVNSIRASAKTCVKLDKSLAIQYTHHGDILNMFFRLPHDGLELAEYLTQGIGDLDRKAIAKDTAWRDWWENKLHSDIKAWWRDRELDEEQNCEGWPKQFNCFLDKIIGDSTLVFLFQKHLALPFVELLVCADEIEPDDGPDGVVDGDIIHEYASLADLLDSRISEVSEASAYSICSAETGKLLFGSPWKAERGKDDSDVDME